MIIGGEPFLRGNNSSDFSTGFAFLQPRFHFGDILYRGDSQLVQGLISNLFTGEINELECTGTLRQGCERGPFRVSFVSYNHHPYELLLASFVN